MSIDYLKEAAEVLVNKSFFLSLEPIGIRIATWNENKILVDYVTWTDLHFLQTNPILLKAQKLEEKLKEYATP